MGTGPTVLENGADELMEDESEAAVEDRELEVNDTDGYKLVREFDSE